MTEVAADSTKREKLLSHITIFLQNFNFKSKLAKVLVKSFSLECAMSECKRALNLK